MPVRVLTFTETVAGVTYTAVTSLPKGSRLLDVLIETTVAWTAATAALDLGDVDASDALAAAVDLTSQFGVAGANQGGTDWGNGLTDSDGPYSATGPGKLYPAGSPITAAVTAGTPGGPTGISRVTLWYEFAGPSRAASVV
jgi:hypothetical protein